MIKLSSLLEHILDHPMKGEAIQEAKRLEDNESDPLVCMEFTNEYEVTEGESVLWVIEITRDSDPFDSFGTIEFNDREEAKKALSMLRAACPEHHVSLFYSLNEDTTDHPDPDVSNTELKPLVDADGDRVHIIVNEGGCYADWQFTGMDADLDARKLTKDTGKAHTACQVMAPVGGECPTIPVATFTPERPHDWIIYWDSRSGEGSFFGLNGVVWFIDHKHHCVRRFATEAAAQDYIDKHNIANAFPWPVPKLSEK